MVDFGWQTSTSVLEANTKMLNEEIATDVAFLVGEVPNQKVIRAHKYILMSRSPVFFGMLAGDMLESHSAEPVEVPDGRPDAFSALLR